MSLSALRKVGIHVAIVAGIGQFLHEGADMACNSAITASLARSRSRAARVSVSILRHLDGFGQHALRRHQIVRHAAAGIFDHAGDAQNTRPSGGTVKRPLASQLMHQLIVFAAIAVGIKCWGGSGMTFMGGLGYIWPAIITRRPALPEGYL
jgi:hypothetical protein